MTILNESIKSKYLTSNYNLEQHVKEVQSPTKMRKPPVHERQHHHYFYVS